MVDLISMFNPKHHQMHIIAHFFLQQSAFGTRSHRSSIATASTLNSVKRQLLASHSSYDLAIYYSFNVASCLLLYIVFVIILFMGTFS